MTFGATLFFAYRRSFNALNDFVLATFLSGGAFFTITFFLTLIFVVITLSFISDVVVVVVVVDFVVGFFVAGLDLVDCLAADFDTGGVAIDD